MCIKILFRYIQNKIQPFLLCQRGKAFMSFFQDFRNIAFSKVQAEPLTFRFTEIK